MLLESVLVEPKKACVGGLYPRAHDNSLFLVERAIREQVTFSLVSRQSYILVGQSKRNKHPLEESVRDLLTSRNSFLIPKILIVLSFPVLFLTS